MTTLQEQLVREVLDRIEERPSTLNQSHWLRVQDDPFSDDLDPETTDICNIRDYADHIYGTSVEDMEGCGTTACFAGHTVLAAMDMGIDIDAEMEALGCDALRLLPYVSIPGLAADLLRLGTDEQHNLFNARNDEIVELVEEMLDDGYWS